MGLNFCFHCAGLCLNFYLTTLIALFDAIIKRPMFIRPKNLPDFDSNNPIQNESTVVTLYTTGIPYRFERSLGWGEAMSSSSCDSTFAAPANRGWYSSIFSSVSRPGRTTARRLEKRSRHRIKQLWGLTSAVSKSFKPKLLSHWPEVGRYYRLLSTTRLIFWVHLDPN